MSKDERKHDIHDIDRVIARAYRIQRAHSDKSSSQSRPNEDTSDLGAIAELNQNISFLRRLFSSTREVYLGLYHNIVTPVWQRIRAPLAWVARIYKRFWLRWAYVHDSTSQTRVISRTRSSVIVILTVLAASICTNTKLGEMTRFFSTEPLVDSLLMATSLRTEVFYLTQSDEIDPYNNVHSVRGCKKIGECSEVDAAYFRVKPRLSHDIWKLIHYGNPLYVPDHVVAPIAPGLNECHVTYYGYRMTTSWIARLLRSMQFYPTMLEARCTYLGSSAEKKGES